MTTALTDRVGSQVQLAEEQKSRKIAMVMPQGCMILKDGKYEAMQGTTPENGGQVIYTIEMARALATQGHEVTIYARNYESDEIITEVDEDYPGFKVVHIPTQAPNNIEKEYFYPHYPEFTARAFKYMEDNSEDYDSIIDHYADGMSVGAALKSMIRSAKKKVLPLIGITHSLGMEKLEKQAETITAKVKGEMNKKSDGDLTALFQKLQKQLSDGGAEAESTRDKLIEVLSNLTITERLNFAAGMHHEESAFNLITRLVMEAGALTEHDGVGTVSRDHNKSLRKDYGVKPRQMELVPGGVNPKKFNRTTFNKEQKMAHRADMIATLKAEQAEKLASRETKKAAAFSVEENLTSGLQDITRLGEFRSGSLSNRSSAFAQDMLSLENDRLIKGQAFYEAFDRYTEEATSENYGHMVGAYMTFNGDRSQVDKIEKTVSKYISEMKKEVLRLKKKGEELSAEDKDMLALAEGRKEQLKVYRGNINTVYASSRVIDDAALDNLQDKKVVMGFGRLVEEKGVLNAVKAFGKILEREPNAVYVYAGGNIPARNAKERKLYKEAMDYAREHGYEDKILFLGSQKQERISQLLNAFDVYLHCAFLEPFGLAPQEAAACGIPVILSQNAGVKEELQDETHALHVDPQDLKNIAEQVCRLLDDNDYTGADLVEAAVEFVRQHATYEGRSKKLIRFLDRLEEHVMRADDHITLDEAGMDEGMLKIAQAQVAYFKGEDYEDELKLHLEAATKAFQGFMNRILKDAKIKDVANNLGMDTAPQGIYPVHPDLVMTK